MPADWRRILPFLIIVLATLPYFVYNTWAPYHTDSAGFVLRAERLVHGEVRPGWRWGTAITEALLGGIPYAMTGDPLWFHRAGTIAGILLFALGMCLLFCREGRLKDATVIAILLLSPAALVTGTIGKEDLIAVGLVLIGVALAERERLGAIIAGMLFGLALATKEIAFAAVAAAMVYLFWKHRERAAWAAIGLGITIPIWWSMLTFVLSERSVGMGKFMGIWSGYGTALSLLLKGMGTAVVIAGIIAGAHAVIKRKWDSAVAILLAIGLILYLAGTSTVSYRNAMWVIPFVAYAASRMEKRWKWAAVAIGIIFTANTFVYMLPTLEFRAATNLPASFPADAKKYLDRNGIMLCMDSSALVKLYTGLETTGHPVFPDENTARKIAAEITELKSQRIVYIYPDYLAYDSGTLLAALKDLRVTPVYTGWYRDYHAVEIYPSVDEWEEQMRNAGYTIQLEREEDDEIRGVPVKKRVYLVLTPDGRTGRVEVYTYKGHVLEKVFQATIFRVV